MKPSAAERFDQLVVVLTAPWFLLPGASESRFVIFIRLARVARLTMAGTGRTRSSLGGPSDPDARPTSGA